MYKKNDLNQIIKLINKKGSFELTHSDISEVYNSRDRKSINSPSKTIYDIREDLSFAAVELQYICFFKKDISKCVDEFINKCVSRSSKTNNLLSKKDIIFDCDVNNLEDNTLYRLDDREESILKEIDNNNVSKIKFGIYSVFSVNDLNEDNLSTFTDLDI